ncbi:MAG: tyrosine-type recombinase/integrase, partial [Acidobacteriota bacterium]
MGGWMLLVDKLRERGLSRRGAKPVLNLILEEMKAALARDEPVEFPLGWQMRFTRAARSSGVKGVALTPEEVEKFLAAAEEVCPEYAPLFLVAVRAGLRRGELVALQWQDLEFGKTERDPNQFILVQHNYVRREHTNAKSKKARRVDMSRELRRVLMKLRDACLATLGVTDGSAIATDLVFS